MLSLESIETRCKALKVHRAILAQALHVELSAFRPLPNVVGEIASLLTQEDRTRALYLLSMRDLVACARPGVRRAAKVLAKEIAEGWKERRAQVA